MLERRLQTWIMLACSRTSEWMWRPLSESGDLWVNMETSEWIWRQRGKKTIHSELSESEDLLSEYEDLWVDLKTSEWIWRPQSESEDLWVDMKTSDWIWRADFFDRLYQSGNTVSPTSYSKLSLLLAAPMEKWNKFFASSASLALITTRSSRVSKKKKRKNTDE